MITSNTELTSMIVSMIYQKFQFQDLFLLFDYYKQVEYTYSKNVFFILIGFMVVDLKLNIYNNYC